MPQTPASPNVPGDAPAVPRALMAAVIGMGIAIVVGVVALVGVIIHRVSAPGPGRVAAPVERPLAAPMAPAQTIPLPPGAHVVSVTARADGTLALLIEDPSRQTIVIWDPARGRAATTLVLQGAR